LRHDGLKQLIRGEGLRGEAFSPADDLGSGWFDSTKNDSVSVKNSKSQIPNHKQIPMIKIQNSKPVWNIGYWNLRFIWNLVLDI
jgi:hypothetical protein